MINLYIEYFESQNQNRKEEIINSILTNFSYDFIDKFIIFASNFDWLSNKDKRIHCIHKEDRCTFGYIFEFADSISKEEDINILINNDIILTNSFKSLKIDEKTLYCIARFENYTDNRPTFANGSGQDAWVWKGKNLIDKKLVNFYMGVLGCDNKLAYEASFFYTNVINPAYTYKIVHNHKSNVRTYTKKTRIPRPYKFVKP